ncbi:MAG: putative metal-dependent phosphoesterase TrpH [Myxococcota bacterium]|jgi:predicted metal-dependent phosphoesterase TrpH
MILDLHNHSIKSDDGRAKVENYCKWIQKRELALDGFVLSEHRQYDSTSDYRPLEDEYGLLILKASEVETEYGHVLLFGVNADLEQAFDFADVRVPLEIVLRESERCGAFAVPCHPSRTIVGMFSHFDELGPAPGVEVVETLNGGGRGTENVDSVRLAEEYGYRGIGGSDAHIVSHIGRCVTDFEDDIASIEDLVSSLGGDRYCARSVEVASGA